MTLALQSLAIANGERNGVSRTIKTRYHRTPDDVTLALQSLAIANGERYGVSRTIRTRHHRTPYGVTLALPRHTALRSLAFLNRSP